ncbi:transglutaminase-like cysteine peptidase [Rhodoferax sp. 4810]|nr:transglutaminase-like cysteine peptidase [Rhodoferax jenense]
MPAADQGHALQMRLKTVFKRIFLDGRLLKQLALALSLLVSSPLVTHASTPPDFSRLFSYKEHVKEGFQFFPMWTRVQQQHPRDLLAERDCEHSRRLSCNLTEWQNYLSTLKSQDSRAQISSINSFANDKKYILDMDNYGAGDYWATVKEFLVNNGDCEDFSIMKYYSLRSLGFSADELRIVIVQDTNLRIPHAILAVSFGGDILILDNQAAQVVSHRHAVHYVPVYSINEKQWWMHLP